MNGSPSLTDLAFVKVENLADRARGLRFFCTATHGDLRISFTIRVARNRRYVTSFPTRHDRHGRQWPIVRPIDDAARRRLEAEVFAALGIKPEEISS
jgi:hypothetical protein